MKFRISWYFHFALFVCSFYIFAIDIQIGIAYFIAILPLFFFTSRGVKLPKEYVPVLLIAAGSIWAFFLLRPLLLVVRPDMFYYPRIGNINSTDHIEVLMQVFVYSGLLLLGLYVAVTIGANKKKKGQYFESDRSGLLLKNKPLIILGAGLIVLFDLYFLLGLNIGVSGAYSPFAFIKLFLPLGLIVPVLALYLLKFRRFLTPIERAIVFSLMGLVILTSLLQGHKSAFISVAEVVFLFYLLEKGNFKISLPKTLFWVGSIVILMLVSFPVATAIRGFMKLDGFSFDIFSIIFESLKRLSDEGFLLSILNRITGRFCGYDGLLAVKLYVPPEIYSIFDEIIILKRLGASLIPKFYIEGISPGKAVGMLYSGHSVNIVHAGALGLFASISLIGKGFVSYIYIVFIGCFFGICFRIANKFKGYEARMLLSIIISMRLVGWLISGNLDANLKSFVVIVLHLTFYFLVCWLIYKVCRPKRKLWKYNLGET
ncbi:MAG: hypothetical protein U5R49_06660 [Deltaproteobacteria bacterium]|nr:hypothetical protein [Deltaproteobacteria bacterium]